MAYILSLISNTANTTLAPIRVIKDKLYDTFLGEHNNNDLCAMERLHPKNSFTDEYSMYLSDPHEIHPGLFLGSAHNAASYVTLLKYNIKYIINVTAEISDYYPSSFTYYRISIRDNNTDSIKDYFEESFDVISYYLNKNDGNVLIHCYMGASRSATIAANYISKTTNIDINIVLADMKKIRPTINPTIKFVRDLNNDQ